MCADITNNNKSKILLILPCNNKAYIGNYFEGENWKYALKKLKDKRIDKKFVDFAACDCIITYLNPKNDAENLGSIVLEKEMDRVKGCDEYPKWDKFKKNNYEILKKHTETTKIAIKRLISHYDLIIASLAIRGYRLAFIRAVLDLFNNDIPKNLVIINGGDSQGWQKKMTDYAIDLIFDFLNGKQIPIEIVEIPEIEKTNPLLMNFKIIKDKLPDEYYF